MKIKFKKSGSQVIIRLFYVLLFSTLIGYLGYYIYAYQNRINVFTLYSNYYWGGVGVVSQIIRFGKDILICVLAVLSVLKMKHGSTAYIVGCSVFFLLLGLINLLFGGGSVLMAVTGVRCYLFFIVLTLVTAELKQSSVSFHTIIKIILLGISINFIVVVEQALRGTYGNILRAGVGGYRFPGLFGGINGLSGFIIAAYLLFIIYDSKKPVNRTFMFICFLISLIITNFCGTRSAMINVILLFVIWLVSIIRMSNNSKYLFLGLSMLIMIPVAVSVATNIAGRGSILQVQRESGRIKILLDILTLSSFPQLMIGRGIGIGSNSDMILRKVSDLSGGQILDGTFNVILYQYGLLGMAVMVFIAIYAYRKVKYNTIFVKCCFFGTLLLQCLTGNILETYGFLIVMFICYWLMWEPGIFKEFKEQGQELSQSRRVRI